MATGYYLAKRGVKTLLIDAFDPPHSLGSHHGDTRMIRHAYGEGASYVPSEVFLCGNGWRFFGTGL
jgi:N-methyl-L-tryptophan oxidase